MPARREIEPESSGLKVIAKDGDLIFKWLTLAQESGHQNTIIIGFDIPNRLETDLELNETRLPNPWGVASTRINARDGGYELKTVFLSASLSKELAEEQGNLTLSPNRYFGLIKKLSPRKKLVNLDKLQRALAPALAAREITISQDAPGRLLLKQSGEAQGTNVEFSFHDAGEKRKRAFCLHLKSGVPDQEEFIRRYHLFAGVMELVASTLFTTNGLAVPNQEIALGAPNGLGVHIERSTQQREQQRHMRVASGLEDGSEFLQEEIRKRITIQRIPPVTFDDIGGQKKAKRELGSIISALKDPRVYETWGTFPPKGVLLFGPPGTGKTLLAQALANAAEATIFSVQATDIVNALFGRSEKLIQAVFDTAKQEQGPVIIFFDEIDALTHHRGRSTEVTSRMVSTLLTNLDGLEGNDDRKVIVVGATNQLSAIDQALLRPGRFDALIEVPLPSGQERERIFEIHMAAARRRAQGRGIFDSNLNLNSLIEQTKDFSGADIKELVRRALAVKVRQQREGERPTPVTTEDVLAEVEAYEQVRKAKEHVGFRRADTNHND
ncbi:MAG: ATP-binding protein [bacterium]|nr:ATP-binding protein [bacterium]